MLSAGRLTLRQSALGAPTAVSLLLLAGAVAVGGLATVEPLYAVALVLATGVAFLVASDIRALPMFLLFTMFVESLSLGPGLRIGRLAGGMALAALALYLLSHGRAARLRPNALLGVAGAIGLWMLVSVYWTDGASYAYANLFSYMLALAYALSFALLVQSAAQLVTLFRTIVFGSAVFGLVAIASYAASGGGDIDEMRAEGLSGDPNYFAIYQVAALPVALALAARETRPPRRLLLYCVVGVIVLAVVSSLSRTGLVALAMVVVVTLVAPWRLFFRRPGQKLAYIAALAAAAVAGAAVGSAAFIERAHSILEPSASGADRGSGRTDLYRASIRGWQEQPWIGLGTGGFQANSLRLLQTTPGVDVRARWVAQGRVVHNAYLEMLTELGVVGLSLFLALLALTARALLLAFRRARAAGERLLERCSVALLVSLVGYVVSAFFLSNQLGKLLWVLVGFALALDTMSRRLEPATAAVPAEARAAPPEYDLDVRERLIEQRERRVSEEFEAIRVERKRLSRLEATLNARSEAAEPGLPREHPAAADDLEQRVAALEARAQAIAKRELAMAKTHAQLAARERELEARERALAAEAEPEPTPPAAVEPEPVLAAAPPPPAPVAERPPEPVAVPAEPAAAGGHNLLTLERLVDEGGAGHPADRLEEWRYYLLYLRDYAESDGSLPESFDFLVWDVFGELLDRRH